MRRKQVTLEEIRRLTTDRYPNWALQELIAELVIRTDNPEHKKDTRKRFETIMAALYGKKEQAAKSGGYKDDADLLIESAKYFIRKKFKDGEENKACRLAAADYVRIKHYPDMGSEPKNYKTIHNDEITTITNRITPKFKKTKAKYIKLAYRRGAWFAEPDDDFENIEKISDQIDLIRVWAVTYQKWLRF